MKIDGLFIAIGHDPATALFKEQLDMDKEGYLITKPDSTETNIPGVMLQVMLKTKLLDKRLLLLEWDVWLHLRLKNICHHNK